MKALFLDIETAPHKGYFWGLFNQNISIQQIVESGYTLCFAARWLGTKQILYRSVHHDGRKRMLRAAHALLSEADVVVHYNGRKFDIPVLNKEFLLESMAPPAPFLQLDLLSVVRKNFRLASNKLDYVGRFLGVGSKVEHRGMEMWAGCMDGDDRAWEDIRRYNRGDVRLLEKVYYRVLPWIAEHPTLRACTEEGARVCPACGGFRVRRRGFYHTKVLRYQRYQCQECGAWSRGSKADTTKLERTYKLRSVV